MRTLAPLLAFALPALALAEGRGVTVVNGAGETIRQIHIAPAGSAVFGENRLRSTLPPGAQGRIGYSTGCRVDIRLAFESGRTEVFLDQDACAELRVTAGGGAAGAAIPPRVADDKRAKPIQKTGAYVPVTVEVPPWTGRSITKKFGGLN